jgi:hypothetical protein
MTERRYGCERGDGVEATGMRRGGGNGKRRGNGNGDDDGVGNVDGDGDDDGVGNVDGYGEGTGPGVRSERWERRKGREGAWVVRERMDVRSWERKPMAVAGSIHLIFAWKRAIWGKKSW